MFTGLVEDVGIIERAISTPQGRELRISTHFRDLVDGESIAVNGACLTVSDHSEPGEANGWFTVAAVETTLGRTTIGEWQAGHQVNLERAMRLGDRLGGHLVLGHVDAVGYVLETAISGDAWLIGLELPPELRPLTVDKGSITVDGVSLTVNALHQSGVQLSIIDYTRRHTTLGRLVAGDRVHVEADVLAKHVERLLASHPAMQSSRSICSEPTQQAASSARATESAQLTCIINR